MAVHTNKLIALLEGNKSLFFECAAQFEPQHKRELWQDKLFLSALRQAIPLGFYSDFFGEHHLSETTMHADGSVVLRADCGYASLNFADAEVVMRPLDRQTLLEEISFAHRRSYVDAKGKDYVVRLDQGKVVEEVAIVGSNCDDYLGFYDAKGIDHPASNSFLLVSSDFFGIFNRDDLRQQKVEKIDHLQDIAVTSDGYVVLGADNALRVYNPDLKAFRVVKLDGRLSRRSLRSDGLQVYLNYSNVQDCNNHIVKFFPADAIIHPVYQKKDIDLDDAKHDVLLLDSARKGFGKGGAVVALSEVNRKVVGRYSYPSNDFSGLKYVLLGDTVGSISHRATVLPWATAELHPTLPIVCVSSLEYIHPKHLDEHPAIDPSMIINCDNKGKHPVSATGWRGNALRFYVLGYDFPSSFSDRVRNLF